MNLRSYATSWQDGAKAPNAKDGRRGVNPLHPRNPT